MKVIEHARGAQEKRFHLPSRSPENRLKIGLGEIQAVADLVQHVLQENELIDAEAHVELIVVLAAKPHVPVHFLPATVGQV
jgi:hypothetical protein